MLDKDDDAFCVKYIRSRLALLKLVCAREDGMCVRCISNEKIINTVLQPGGGVELSWSDGSSSHGACSSNGF